MALERSRSGPAAGADPGESTPSGGNGGGAPVRVRIYVDADAATIARDDDAAAAIRVEIEQAIESDSLDIPRHPDVAARILDLSKDPDVSMREILAPLRNDPVLSGKLIEMANSAAFAGSQPVYSLQMAVVRLGMRKVAQTALELSGGQPGAPRRKRGVVLESLWKHSLAVGFGCEALARAVPSVSEEEAFLTGIFHDVASPVVVDVVGKLERAGTVPRQGDARLLGLLDRLAVPLTGEILRRWHLPVVALEAIRLQASDVRERRGRPLAHLLVCAKAIAKDLGIGKKPVPLRFEDCPDFRRLGLDDGKKTEPARETVLEKMIQLGKGD